MADTTGGASEPQSRLHALRASGADRRDPVRFAYLESLERRAATQPEAVRRALLARLDTVADQLAALPGPSGETPVDNATTSPLAELLAYIGQHAHEQPETPHSPAPSPNTQRKARPRAPRAPELKSVAYFRNTWSKLSAEQQLTQTLAQAPENAGPMNSQHLVLRSLQVMRDVAPDYLRGFMSYVDTLIWLEHADPTRPTARSEGERKPRAPKRNAGKRQAS
ncbi:DUF2894 domain-containing protein [Dechloromonas sp. ARDL1]|uniref:DUF2894 domain-containing protein n=1 Tax=Dechloromonas sp. ARDL1 TaxID=3322121 RepID=UPI003DA78F11